MRKYKTDELADLFPDAYALDDTSSLLYKLLDAVGAELMVADGKVKRLLKSHWVDHASGRALDGLGAIYGVQRRRLPGGKPEPDSVFRSGLRAVVPLFTGGGTQEAIKGAVRSALGLPFNRKQSNLPPEFDGLWRDIEDLITLEEFSPTVERFVDDRVEPIDDASELTLAIDVPSVRKDYPRISWTFTKGSGRRLSLERLDTGAGVRSKDGLLVGENQILSLSAGPDGDLSAIIGVRDVSSLFTNLDGTEPAIMPEVPGTSSEWRFRAQSGVLDVSEFDAGELGADTYDLPLYEVEMIWTRREPLTFDVHVPYFLRADVEALVKLHGYGGDIFVFEELPRESIQEVVDQTRAAGVRGHVHFSLRLPVLEDKPFEDHQQYESARIAAEHRATEDAGAADSLAVGSLNRETEAHDLDEVFVIGGVWDVSTFDGSYGFQ